jgi:C4-dicarboxylate-specific signal transduction histidine kinase
MRIVLFSFFFFYMLSGSTLRAQITEDKVKANIIYHISDFVVWPDNNKEESFHIVVLGDRPELTDELTLIANKKKKLRMSINVTSQMEQKIPVSTHVLFVDKAYYDNIETILAYCKNNQILLITDELNDRLKTVINLTKTKNKNISFEVNKQNLILSHLNYSNELLLYGGSELDVKDLYFQTQNLMDSISNQLKIEAIKIKKLESIVESKNDILRSQNSTISAYTDSILATKKRLKVQSEIVNSKTQIIEDLTLYMQSQNKKVSTINEEIEDQTQLQNDLEIKIEKDKRQLDSLISEIDNKNITLDEQDALISSQTRLLYLSFAFGGLLVLVIFTVFRFFYLKKKHNAQLEEKINDRTRELKYSNERFLSLFNNAPEAILETDFSLIKKYFDELNIKNFADFNNYFDKHTDFNIECANRLQFINVNKAALELYQISSKDEVLELYKSMHDSGKLTEALPEFALPLLNTVSSSFETTRLNKHGEKLDLIIKWLDVSDQAGTFTRVILSIVDITQLRNIETQLRRHQEKLEMLVEEKTQNLISANKELEVANWELFEKHEIINQQNTELLDTLENLKKAQIQLLQAEKMASLGVLTAGVAHEINNPLNYIMGAHAGLVRYFKDQEEVADLEEVEIYLRNLKIGLDRATNIVHGLNQFSRESKTDNEDCDIEAIIDNCLTMLNSDLKHRVEIVKDYTEKPYNVVGNVGRLHQVFLNILGNSAQAIAAEGVITIKTSANTDHVKIEISDSGEGISAENLSKITDPFFTTKDPGKGTGLGLSITYNILREHSGTLEFESEVGLGTVAKIMLPIQ